MDGRYAVVPAGEQVPATIDEVELVTDFPGPSITNQTYEMPDGTIAPLEFPSGESEGPQPFRVERRDGCTELTGPGIEKLLPGDRHVGRAGGHATTPRSTGATGSVAGPSPFGGALFSLLLVSGSPTELPSISVVESDGLWYVSPIGTLGASVVELFRSLPDDANLIDTPLAPWFFNGMGRQAIDASLAAASTIPTECEAVAAVGADGVPAVIADPPVSAIRACVTALFNVTYQSEQRQLHRSRPGRRRSQRPGVDRSAPRGRRRRLTSPNRARQLKSGQSEFVHRRRCSNSFCPDFGTRCVRCRLRSAVTGFNN